MGSMAPAALSLVKSSAELQRAIGEAGPTGATSPFPRFQKKAARISELLLENSTTKDKLEALDAAEDAQLEPRQVGNPMWKSSLDESLADSISPRGTGQGTEGGVSGKHQWRKLNKAIVATKVLATRPNALSQGRQPALQALAHQGQHAHQANKDPMTPDFLLGPGEGMLRRLNAAVQNTFAFLTKRMVILPETSWYQVWWFFYAVAIAMVSCWVEPFQMAFQHPGVPTSISGMSIIEYVIIVTFLMDFLLKFFVAYFDPETGVLVTTQPKMAFAYCKSVKFTLDLMGCFPYDMLVTAIARRCGATTKAQESVDWLKLMALSRAYRVFDLFHVLDYRMMLSQGTLMLLRNYIYVFFTAHWAACIFFHIAQEESNVGRGADDSWVARNAEAFLDRPLFQQYILSLYFTVTIFTSMGDGRLYPFTIAELSTMIVYLLFNLFLGAYIIGTVTIMMVRADEHSKSFRESMSHLHEYSRENDLPERLYKAMREHLEVHFDSMQTTDDSVLSIYPTTIRRLVLRHLYLQPVRNCYLFKGCKQRFLDALLTAARVELFLPGVEIMAEGDNVMDLLIVMLGECLVSRGGQRIGGVYGTSTVSASGIGSEANISFLNSRGPSETGSLGGQSVGGSCSSSVGKGGETSLSVQGSADRSVHNITGGATPLLSPGGISLLPPVPGTTAKVLNLSSPLKKGPSDVLAEIAFFTDAASYETVVGRTPVRVLSLPKASWELLAQQFPQQAKLILDNVQRAAETAVVDNLKQAAMAHQLTASQLHVALSLVSGNGFADSTDPMVLAETRDALTHHQMEMITRLDDMRTVAEAHTRKCDEMRTFEFLNTAAQGDVESLRTMLAQGISPNTADYDGRTGLMLSSAKGHDEMVQLLLDAGAEKNKTDAFGISALAEAVKNEHDSTIELMLKYGATLGAGGLAVASEMCTAVYEGNLVKLRRLLRSGAPPDACDYDKRSALHIAGAEGNLAAVKLLIEEGGADPNFQDRWGNTALDEARRVGATPVVAYLESRQTRDAGVTAEKKRQQAAHEFISWCGVGQVEQLRNAGGYSYGDEAGCAFAGLLVAASKGHKDVVEVLLEGMPSATLQNHAHVGMLEAARMGHPETVAVFRRAGVALHDERVGGALGAAAGSTMRSLMADLRSAVQQGSGAVLEALLALGMPLTRNAGESSSLVHVAVEHGHLGATRRLVEHGGAVADLLSLDGLGRTPLQMAERQQQLRPQDLHARAVLDYLLWATQLAAAGSSAAALAAAAVERWGPIGHPAIDKHVPDVVALIGPTPAAIARGGSSKRLLIPGLEGSRKGAGERLTLSQRPEASRGESGMARSTPNDTNTGSFPAVTPALTLQAVTEESARLSPLSEESLGASADGSGAEGDAAGVAAATTAPGGGGDVLAGLSCADLHTSLSIPTVVDVWDSNLPGTPGESTKGESRAGGGPLLVLGSRGSPAEAAQLYNATVQHSSALLNDPPVQIGAAAGRSPTAAAAAAAARAGSFNSVVGAVSGANGTAGTSGLPSPLPGVSLAHANSANLGSPRLVLPPAIGRGLTAGPLGSPSFSPVNGGSRSAASRLFGALGTGSDGGARLTAPSEAAVGAADEGVGGGPAAGGGGGGGGGGTTSFSSVGSSRVGSAAGRGFSSPAVGAAAAGVFGSTGQPSWRRNTATVSPVVEDEIEQYMFTLADNAGAGAGVASPADLQVPEAPGALGTASFSGTRVTAAYTQNASSTGGGPASRLSQRSSSLDSPAVVTPGEPRRVGGEASSPATLTGSAGETGRRSPLSTRGSMR
ncbi:hypothetical protein VaNZ11_004204 [Volvox africanus]|uniref:Ion transport domain-containing protein n=1 Tax=Volvox africanus TaxID=51714 RepID=A0ABQ5RVY8_9CHLO|nr:hypothetical protein VaNZ11_004204 [Volvox africanus]